MGFGLLACQQKMPLTMADIAQANRAIRQSIFIGILVVFVLGIIAQGHEY